MIWQIPRSTHVVTLGRPQEVETSVGRLLSSLPEVELPDDFNLGKVRNWTRKVPSKRLQTNVERRTSELESA